MSPITDDEQVDELKERRRARESRPGSKRAAPARIPSAEPARDLLGGLITSGSRSPKDDENSSADAQDAANGAPAPAREATSASDASESGAESTARAGGENIDELIRRVKEGAPADADVATTIQQRRPKGTADLSPAAAPRRARTRPGPATGRRWRAPRPQRTRLLGIAAAIALAGATVLVLHPGGGSSLPSPARSGSSSTSTTGSFGAFGGALTSAIAAVGSELQPFAQRAVSTKRASRARPTAAHRRSARSHVTIKRHIRRKAQQPTRAVAGSSPSTTATTVQTQTYAPASPPVTTPSQSPVSATHSTTSSTRPSGPTGSNPLGGIGSCVKGC
jgi:hypothetical protein